MKIGILTYHRSHNYGALLQAVALRYFLSSLGHDVFFIDYWPEYHKRMYKLIDLHFFKEYNFLCSLKYLIKESLVLPLKIGRSKKFKEFIQGKIEPSCRGVDNKFDCIIYGSDQIWRKQSGLKNQFNPVYFGEGKLLTRFHISYAASMGVEILDKNDKNNLRKWLKKYDGVSVRESSLRKILDEIGINNVSQTVDPTLLLDRYQWEEMVNPKGCNGKPYVLFYDLMTGSFDKRVIQKYANERGLELITITGKAKLNNYKKNIKTVLNPFGMINYIANAECVFTSSFHGLVFSLIFNKNVYASFKYNSARAVSLLDSLGLKDVLLKPMEKEIPYVKIDYNKCNQYMAIMRNESKEWLMKTLNSLQR